MENNKQNNPHEKEVLIIVNTREKTWAEKEISYEQLIILAFGTISNDENVVYTITYTKGEKPKHEGTLVKGQTVKVKGGMIFNVTPTNKS